jgi:hypothetical protein
MKIVAIGRVINWNITHGWRWPFFTIWHVERCFVEDRDNPEFVEELSLTTA